MVMFKLLHLRWLFPLPKSKVNLLNCVPSEALIHIANVCPSSSRVFLWSASEPGQLSQVCFYTEKKKKRENEKKPPFDLKTKVRKSGTILVGSGAFPSQLPSPLPVQWEKDIPTCDHRRHKRGIEPGGYYHTWGKPQGTLPTASQFLC